MELKLYLIHCGFYDPEVCDGIYEGHVTLPVVATSFEEARRNVRANPVFRAKRMHVDGAQEIDRVEGYRITATADLEGAHGTLIHSERHRDF